MPGIQVMAVNRADATFAVEQVDGKTAKIEGMVAAFSSYMQQNSAANANVAANQQDMPQPSAANNAVGNVQNDYDQFQSKLNTKAKEGNNAVQASQDQETVSETVNEAVEEIKDIIKEELGTCDEQLEAAMELLGLTQTDLLIPQNLVMLTTELTGSQDAGMMLFNEDLQSILPQVTEVSQKLLEELGISMEDLMAQLNPPQEENLPQMDAQPVEEAFGKVMAEAEPLIQEMRIPQPEAEPVVRQAQEELSIPQPVKQEQNVPQTYQQATDTSQEEAGLTEDLTVKPEQLTQKPQSQEQAALNDQGAGEKEAQGQKAGSQEFAKEPQPETMVHSSLHQSTNPAPVTSQPVQTSTPMPQIDIQNVIEQIVEYTRTNITDAARTIEMQLNPENLGKLYLHISEKEGAVTAQITAQNEELKEALLQQAAVLRDNLSQQGVKVQAVEVSVGTHEFENNLEKDAHQQEEQARQQEEQSGRRSRRQINLNELDELTGLMSEEEMLAARIMRDNGNNLDYKA